jgi:predicted nucleic acid-binding protein
MLDEDFLDRVLPFDLQAAIGLSRQATLATRNTTDFEAAGLPLINPWNPDV